MVAISASFVTPRSPVSSDAFGGVINLSRMLLASGPSKPVVCSECRTINRNSAMFCKGCDGKLPAFYAAGGDAGAPSDPPLTTPVAALVRAFAVPALAVVVALVMLLAGLGLWYADRSQQEPPSASPHVSTAAAAPPAAPSVAPALLHAVSSPPPADALNDESIIAAALIDESAEAASTTPPAPTAQRREARHRAALAPSEMRTTNSTLRRVASSNPIALCEGRNFLARAVCINNRCALAASASHPQCAKARYQRRQDEARRNPSLIN
jgi:hypothetical protein